MSAADHPEYRYIKLPEKRLLLRVHRGLQRVILRQLALQLGFHLLQVGRVDGREILEYYDTSGLSLVAFRTPTAVYWVSNTLTDSIPSGELIAIAALLRPR